VRGNVSPLQIVPFISAFKAMNKVVETCFSNLYVVPDVLENQLNHLKKMYIATGLSETIKIHSITCHLKDCIIFLKNRGLGMWSEQTGESIHREFLKYWNRYKINVNDDSDYGTRLKRAVMDFSTDHL
jgi:hypothetical protein